MGRRFPLTGSGMVFLVLALTLTPGLSAWAHFLFVRIGPMGEGGRRAEVYFSEKAEAGDPRYVANLAGTKLWAQTEPGKFQEIPVSLGVDRLRAPLPSNPSLGVIGVSEYGVRLGSNKTPFLLRYYPKAVAGPVGDVNKLKPRPEIPFEILAKFDAEGVLLTVLHDGKPAPGAKLVTIDRDLTNVDLTADASGQVRWKPGAGDFSVYGQRVLKTPGERDGARYDEIREFATLAFRHPLERDDADSEAVAEFEKAIASRAQWKDFPGFSAKIEGVIEGRDFTGDVVVAADGKVKLTIDDEVHAGWISDQLGSIVLHRRATSPSAERPVLRFADDDEIHPMGRLLDFEGGRFASSYRILDGKITTVNRDMGRSFLTIITLDTEKNAEGAELPKSYVVETWDNATGRLNKAETVRDTWVRVGPLDLPALHTVTTSDANGLITRSVRLHDHVLAKPAAAPR